MLTMRCRVCQVPSTMLATLKKVLVYILQKAKFLQVSILTIQVKRRHFTTDERASVVVSKRLFKCAGRKGFGNARAVRKEVEKAVEVCMGRVDFDKDNMVSIFFYLICINFRDMPVPVLNPKS